MITRENNITNPPRVSSAVCTLCEGDYHLGVAALANSLHAAGFRGRFYIGYRGPLPKWARIDAAGEMSVGDGMSLCFRTVPTDWHLANYKPTFMRTIWECEGAEWPALFYFDPDITVKTAWPEFEFWAECGVAVVEDVMNGEIGITHPLRTKWRHYAAKMDVPATRSLGEIYNSGFVGLSRNHRPFLDIWEKMLGGLFPEYSIDPRQFMCGGKYTRAFPFIGPDQDALNVALMAYAGELSCVGPAGMDFTYGGYFMSHAIASPKPWRGDVLHNLLRGRAPGQALRRYWNNVRYPIAVYPEWRVKLARLTLAIAAGVGRFYQRN